MRVILASTALSLALAAPGIAQEASIGAGVSSLGPVVEGTLISSPNLSFRGLFFVPIDFNFDGIDVGNNYTLDGTVNVGAGAVLADYHPFSNAFSGVRVSGGLFFAPDDFATGRFNGIVPFNGALEPDQSVAPMLSIGYRHTFNNGIYLSGDLGAIVTGFTATTASTNPAVLTEVGNINSSLDDLPVYPYVALTIGFTF